MRWQARHVALAHLLACGIALSASADAARASSEFIQGQFTENDPAGPSYQGPGVCRFITGPRDNLKTGRFLITAGGPSNADQIRLYGSFRTSGTAANPVFTLQPNRDAAETYVENTLRKELANRYAVFKLDKLTATVREARFDRLICEIELTGQIKGGGLRPADVRFSFSRQGLYDESFAAPASAPARAAAATAAANTAALCPTRDPNNLAASLAPLGLAPVPAQCGTKECLVDFKGYKWWTSFQYYGAPGGYFPAGGYFYNGGLQTPFAPRNVFVDSAGLHLKIATQDLGGGPTTAGSEVALMFRSDMSEANLGYGDYLVTATVKSAPSWATLDPNAAFGAFTFERVGKGSSGPTTNPHREIDLAEISRWGWNHAGSCPFKGSSTPLCDGNAQFTLQPWESNPQNLHRYTIRPNVATMTLVMKWHGEGQPVEFAQYDGAFNFANLPARSDNSWTSQPGQNNFIPATRCERFHLNFWLGNYTAQKNPNPPPKTLPQEIVVTNFEFRKVSSLDQR